MLIKLLAVAILIEGAILLVAPEPAVVDQPCTVRPLLVIAPNTTVSTAVTCMPVLLEHPK